MGGRVSKTVLAQLPPSSSGFSSLIPALWAFTNPLSLFIASIVLYRYRLLLLDKYHGTDRDSDCGGATQGESGQETCESGNDRRFSQQVYGYMLRRNCERLSFDGGSHVDEPEVLHSSLPVGVGRSFAVLGSDDADSDYDFFVRHDGSDATIENGDEGFRSRRSSERTVGSRHSFGKMHSEVPLAFPPPEGKYTRCRSQPSGTSSCVQPSLHTIAMQHPLRNVVSNHFEKSAGETKAQYTVRIDGKGNLRLDDVSVDNSDASDCHTQPTGIGVERLEPLKKERVNGSLETTEDHFQRSVTRRSSWSLFAEEEEEEEECMPDPPPPSRSSLSRAISTPSLFRQGIVHSDEESNLGCGLDDEDGENESRNYQNARLIPRRNSHRWLPLLDFNGRDSTITPLSDSRPESEVSSRRGSEHGPDPAASVLATRADYNARIMPAKVVMIRHGQSEGNVDERLYSIKPDNAMPLTPQGWEQARLAGQVLRRHILATGEAVHFIVSPYVRTVETFHGIVSAWCDPKSFRHIKDPRQRQKAWYRHLRELGLSWHEDPRIREQDFGNYQDPETIKKCKKERHKFGAFYYRFPHGESASDVYDRVSTFLDSLWRNFDTQKARNYVLVTHGISIRVLLARYYKYSVDQFHVLANPKNCECIVLGHDGAGRLQLEGRYELEIKEKKMMMMMKKMKKKSVKEKMEKMGQVQGDLPKEDSFDESIPQKGTNLPSFKFYEKLRTLPRDKVVQRRIRLSPDDGTT